MRTHIHRIRNESPASVLHLRIHTSNYWLNRAGGNPSFSKRPIRVLCCLQQSFCMVTELINDWPSRKTEVTPSLIYCYKHDAQKYDSHNQVSTAVGSTLADAVAVVSSANRACSENKHTVRKATICRISSHYPINATASEELLTQRNSDKQTVTAAQTLAAQADGTIATLMSFNGWRSNIMRSRNGCFANESFTTDFKY